VLARLDVHGRTTPSTIEVLSPPAALPQVGLSVQEEDPRSLPLAARFSPAPGTLLQHSLHHVLAQESAAVSTTPDAVKGLAGVSGRGV
jgi:hypothetical protein